jgi:predicted phage terminase large subunit-like protein
MPPQHGKSTLTSANFPAWFLGKFPRKNVILTAYEADFAESWGAKARDIMETYGPTVFGMTVRKDKRAGSSWQVCPVTNMTRYQDGGTMRTAGMGGAITGKGADILIIDDPIKNDEQARSKVTKEHQWDWYQSTAYTRLSPTGAIIIIQTRWAEDDLSGRAIKEMNEGRSTDKWHIIKLKAFAKENDILGRAYGDALFPQRYDKENLTNIKSNLTAYWWSALYDQEPTPEEGNIFKRQWWKFYPHHSLDNLGRKKATNPDGFDEITVSFDCSFKDLADSSYVVGGVWGRRGANKYLLDLVRDKMDYPTTKLAIKATLWKWKETRRVLIEDKANGTAVIQDLKNELSSIIPVPAVTSKVARAQGCSSTVEAGNVYLPEGAPWVQDFIEELCSFPNAEYDDQVDMTSQYLNDCLEREGRPKVGVYGIR